MLENRQRISTWRSTHHVCGYPTHHSHCMRTVKASINPWTDKSIPAQVHSGILLTCKEQNCQICKKIGRTSNYHFKIHFYSFFENVILAYNVFRTYPPSNSSQTFTTTPLRWLFVLLFFTHWVPLVLFLCGCACGHPLEHGHPTRDHTPQENWLDFPKQPSTVTSSSAVDWGLWAPPGSVQAFSLARSRAGNLSSCPWVQQSCHV